MSCTTLLVGKNASYDGSTMIARNDDSGANGFTPKKFIVISSKEQKRKYKTVISHLEIDLPDHPMSIQQCLMRLKEKEFGLPAVLMKKILR